MKAVSLVKVALALSFAQFSASTMSLSNTDGEQAPSAAMQSKEANPLIARRFQQIGMEYLLGLQQEIQNAGNDLQRRNHRLQEYCKHSLFMQTCLV